MAALELHSWLVYKARVPGSTFHSHFFCRAAPVGRDAPARSPPGCSVGAYPWFGRVRSPHIACHYRRVRPLRQWAPSYSDATGQLLDALQPPPLPRSGLRDITDSGDICWGGPSASPGEVGREDNAVGVRGHGGSPPRTL